MADWLLFVLAVLACYRLSRLFALNEGPGSMFLRLRVLAGGYDLGENGEANTNLGRGITCPHCWGVWWAALLALALWGFAPLAALYWLAIAGGQSFLQSISDG